MSVHFVALWEKTDNEDWYQLNEVDTGKKNMEYYECVYILWDDSSNSILKVDHGVFSDKIQEYKDDYLIQKHQKSGKVNITWAMFPDNLLDGVAAYLDYKLKPSLGKRHPLDFLIPVNLPVEV